MNEKVLEKELLQIKNAVTMPENLAAELSETALEKGQKKLSDSAVSAQLPQHCFASVPLELPLLPTIPIRKNSLPSLWTPI